ncbi:Dyp-type peroxidase [Frankia tisae]|uniref:Dyp-type peroxidase n=1 Tax=Frankia tisae TaxID=2950104 RepID=UPI0021C14AD9|nr:Dyp-type peroxidase [Frankia tisae]
MLADGQAPVAFRRPADHSPEQVAGRPPSRRDPHRRGVLGTAGLLGTARLVAGAGLLGGAGVLGGALAPRGLPGLGAGTALATDDALAASDARHQPGIADTALGWLVFTAYDLTAADPGTARSSLAAVLRAWTSGAAALTTGPAPGGGRAGLTVTVGLGASALRHAGLDGRVPGELADIPAMPGDQLDPARGGGDLGVQVCATDPATAIAAAARMGALAAPFAAARWEQRGFQPTASDSANPPDVHRNLMGQLDGMSNLQPGTPQFDQAVWASGEPAWMRDGSYLVIRRIRMLFDAWNRLTGTDRDEVIGRRESDGVPLSAGPGGTAFTVPDINVRRADGRFAIAADAHVRVSSPPANGGAVLFRRGYSYDDGLDSTGTRDAGLFFMAYQADPRTAFVPIQQSMAASDALNTFTRHTSSALFAVPPMPRPGGYLAQALLEDD